MTGAIRIPISADLSGVKQAVDDLAQGTKTALGQDLNTKGIDKLVDGLDQASKSAKAVEQAIGGAGSKATAGTQKAGDAQRKLNKEMAESLRLQAALAKAGHKATTHQASEARKDYDHYRNHNATGATKRNLTGISFESFLAGGGAVSPRQRSVIMGQLGFGAPASPAPQPQAGGTSLRDLLRRAGSGVSGALFSGGGVGGAIAQAALAGGAGGSSGSGGTLAGAGLARMAGGLGLATLAYGAVRGIMATKAKVGAAQDEGVGYADMLRQMGATTSTFDQLRSSVRDAAKSIDLSFGDGSALARGYLSAGGLDGISAGKLADEVQGAGSFARGMGLAPEAGTGFFGTLRHNKVSGGDADNKRFAMMVGEAVARAGVFTKADEVLAAVAGYTKMATSAALMPANTAGYVGAMGSLLNERRAGMDPAGAANMLSTIDGSMRHGGGEAQRNFLLGSLQRAMPGMTAVDMGFMQDAGMFGTAKQVFGEGSTAYAAADGPTQERYTKLAAAGGDRTFFDMAMGQMGGMSGDMQRKNMMGLFGLSDSQAALLQKVTAERGGSLQDTITGVGQKYGIDAAKLNGTSMRNVLDIEYGDPAQLRSKAAWFKAQGMSGDDKVRVDAALGTPGAGDEHLKKVLMEMAPKYTTEMTEGDATRKNQANMENLATEVATKLVPATNAIREAVTAIAGWGGFKDKYTSSQNAGKALDTLLNSIKPDDALGRHNVFKREAERMRHHESDYTDEYRQRIADGIESTGQKVDSAPATPDGKTGTEVFSGDPDEFLRKTRRAAEIAAKRIGGNVKPEWLQGQWAHETGWGAKVLKGTNNLGNIKAGRGAKNARTFNVMEEAHDGSQYRVNSAFRSYSNLDQFGADAGDLLGQSVRYYGVKQAGSGSEFAQALQDNGYATDHNYAGRVAATIKSVEQRMKASATTVTPGATPGVTHGPTPGATPLPPGAASAGAPAAGAVASAPQNQSIDLYLRDPRTGAQLADPARVNVPGAPRAAGVR